MRHGTRSVGSSAETSANARSRAFGGMKQPGVRGSQFSGRPARPLLLRDTVTYRLRFSGDVLAESIAARSWHLPPYSAEHLPPLYPPGYSAPGASRPTPASRERARFAAILTHR